MSLIETALLVVALVLSGIELLRSRGQSLVTWAVFLIALVLVLGRIG